MALTASPDAPHMLAGPGTAAEQTARPRLIADHENGGWTDAPITATGATSGAPGTFTPAGAVAPANLAALQAGGITATPSIKWVAGNYVTLGDASQASWSGTAWVNGPSPVEDTSRTRSADRRTQ